jgi:uncharacterized repeat protein (TIGR03803 family)
VVEVVVSAPFVTQQPASQTLAPGLTAVLKATALGNLPLRYQWQANGTNLNDAGNLSGATSDTLTISKVTEANNGTYTLFVTNSLGWTNSSGAVLSIIPVTAPGTRLSTLYSLASPNDGRSPSELVDGLDGYLYGTTRFGGSFRDGNVFKIGINGGFANLVSFNDTNGGAPLAGLVRSTNGNFYGTTSGGGDFSAGTLFAVTPTGTLSTLHTFSDGIDGASPATRLVEGLDGSLYGSTQDGGGTGLGSLFRITPEGTLTTLHSFSGGEDGTSPAGALVEGSAGTFYGLTGGGGAFNDGSVFRISTIGALTTLYSFTGGTDGSIPVGSLVLGDDGDLYGATKFNSIRGFAFYGTLFRLSLNGALKTLYALNFTDGSYPAAGLVLGSDGNFYGTTEQGGLHDFGTLFRMTPAGALSTLVDFDGFNDGANPQNALTVGADGNLYGTTSSGGPGGRGTIFRLSFTDAPQITSQPVSRTASTGGTAAFSVAVTGGTPLSYQWQSNGTNLTDGGKIHGASTRILTLSNLTIADGGEYSVMVTNASGFAASAPATLTVKPSPPLLHVAVQSNGMLTLTWSAVPGRNYQLQSKLNLGSTTWSNVGNPLLATSETVETSTAIDSSSQLFYRVILLP